MNRLIFIFIAGLFSAPVCSQVWTYKAVNDYVAGNNKTARVQGIGTEWPYTKPLFILIAFSDRSKNPEIYFTKVPCACCDNLRTVINFDNEEKRYRFRVSTNENENICGFVDYSSVWHSIPAFQRWRCGQLDQVW